MSTYWDSTEKSNQKIDKSYFTKITPPYSNNKVYRNFSSKMNVGDLNYQQDNSFYRGSNYYARRQVNDSRFDTSPYPKRKEEDERSYAKVAPCSLWIKVLLAFCFLFTLAVILVGFGFLLCYLLVDAGSVEYKGFCITNTQCKVNLKCTIAVCSCNDDTYTYVNSTCVSSTASGSNSNSNSALAITAPATTIATVAAPITPAPTTVTTIAVITTAAPTTLTSTIDPALLYTSNLFLTSTPTTQLITVAGGMSKTVGVAPLVVSNVAYLFMTAGVGSVSLTKYDANGVYLTQYSIGNTAVYVTAFNGFIYNTELTNDRITKMAPQPAFSQSYTNLAGTTATSQFAGHSFDSATNRFYIVDKYASAPKIIILDGSLTLIDSFNLTPLSGSNVYMHVVYYGGSVYIRSSEDKIYVYRNKIYQTVSAQICTTVAPANTWSNFVMDSLGNMYFPCYTDKVIHQLSSSTLTKKNVPVPVSVSPYMLAIDSLNRIIVTLESVSGVAKIIIMG